MNSSLTITDYFYSKLYYGLPTASADGTVDKDEGSSLSVGTTFGSVGGGTTLASDPVSIPSSLRTSSATHEWRASITHYAVTCSATIYACGTKLSPSTWISSALQPLVYPL